MIGEESISLKTIELLNQIKAIQIDVNKPFKWSSGKNSPIYCDNRLILSHPPIRNFVRTNLVNLIEHNFVKADVIVGVATGAIAIGALVAEQLGLPYIYARPEKKAHGKGNLIEGDYENFKSAIVIEDLISTGASSLKVVKELEKEGIEVKGLCSIFSYGLAESIDLFKKNNVECFSLANFDTLIKFIESNDFFQPKMRNELMRWNDDPNKWSKTKADLKL